MKSFLQSKKGGDESRVYICIMLTIFMSNGPVNGPDFLCVKQAKTTAVTAILLALNDRRIDHPASLSSGSHAGLRWTRCLFFFRIHGTCLFYLCRNPVVKSKCKLPCPLPQRRYVHFVML